MYRVDVYLRVRRAVMVEGMSVREAARTFGLHRDTVRKMLEYSVPPGYRRQVPPRRPKLEPFSGVIDRILEDDHQVPSTTTTVPQFGQLLAGNRFAEGKATKLSRVWASRHEEVLKVPFLRTVVVVLGSSATPPSASSSASGTSTGSTADTPRSRTM